MSNLRTVREIHDAFDAGKISPLDLTKEHLARIKASNHNAFITVCADRALDQAKRATEKLSNGKKVPREAEPLFGIPIGIKDTLVVDGIETTCASKILKDYIPPYTATAVKHLEHAGAVNVGKLNMDEFAMGSSNENSAFGPVKHPTHPDRVPGGSSGGSACAVKADLCVVSLGTDTGGSIRLPASYCGVVGFKPTYGRVSRYGLIAFGSSLDQIGPFANTVEDAARVYQVMHGPDEMDVTSAPIEKSSAFNEKVEWSKVRIGIPDEHFLEGLQPAVEKAISASVEWFKKKGAKIVSVKMPYTTYALPTYYVVALSEASSNLARFDGIRYGKRPKEANEAPDLETFYKKVRAHFGDEVKRRIILGTFALSSGYYEAYYQRACKVRRLICQDYDRAFKEVDVMLSPVAPGTAFKLGEKARDPMEMYLVDVFTIPASLAGLPAISIPCGEDGQGLSIGLQMTAARFQEDRLLSLAHGFEKGQLQ